MATATRHEKFRCKKNRTLSFCLNLASFCWKVSEEVSEEEVSEEEEEEEEEDDEDDEDEDEEAAAAAAEEEEEDVLFVSAP